VVRVIIVGLGALGKRLAEELSGKKGVELVLLDRDEIICKEAADRYDALVLRGDGTDPKLLQEAGIQGAVLVAATGSDPINTVVGILAKQAGAERAIVVLDDLALRTACQTAGVDIVVSPVISAANEIAGYIFGEESLDFAVAVAGGARVAELSPGPLAGKKLSELTLPKGTVIPLVLREGRALVPTDETALAPEDVVILLAESDEKLAAAKRLFSPATPGG
jgi:trk system potassium uptake protein TrkA